MGCNQSKIENKEALARCKERKRFMKEAVSSRNAFAAAHSSYTTCLKNTGAALGDFAHGEVQNPQLPLSADSSYMPPPPPQQPFEIRPPPPPLPNFAPTVPLQRAVSMPEIKITKPEPKPVGTIDEVDEEGEEELESEGSLRKRSSNRSTSGNSRRVEEDALRPPAPPFMSESETPPPQPPPPQPHPHPQQNSAWDYFFNPSMENIAGTSLNEAQEDTLHKEEEIERKVFDVKPKRVNVDVVDEKVVRTERNVEVPVHEPEPAPEETVEESLVLPTKANQAVTASVEGKRMVNLLKIFDDIDDHFLKASESAHEVSKMLEATRLHYHSNFADNRGSADLDNFVSAWRIDETMPY